MRVQARRSRQLSMVKSGRILARYHDLPRARDRGAANPRFFNGQLATTDIGYLRIGRYLARATGVLRLAVRLWGNVPCDAFQQEFADQIRSRSLTYAHQTVR